MSISRLHRARARTSSFLAVLGLALAGCTHANSSAEGGAAAGPFAERDAVYDVARLDAGPIVTVGRYGAVARSEDGGRSWRSIDVGLDEDLLSVAFHGDRGLAIGSRNAVLESDDGGRSWARGESPFGEDKIFEVALEDESSAMAVGAFGAAYRRVGTEWVPMEIPWGDFLAAVWEEAGEVAPHLYDVTFVAGSAWIVGEYGLVLRSDDAGATWTKLAGGALADPHLFAIDVLGAERMAAVGQAGTVRLTTDGGETWHREQPTTVALYDVVLSTDGALGVVGDLGVALIGRPSSDGVDWTTTVVTGSGAEDDRQGKGDWIARALENGEGGYWTFGKAGVGEVGARSDDG